MAAIIETNWQNFLSSDSGLPPDVFFVVKKDEDEEKKGSGWKTIEAHKFLLAGTSPVFMAQFFGIHKEKRDIIPIEDSHYDAYKILLDLLYN